MGQVVRTALASWRVNRAMGHGSKHSDILQTSNVATTPVLVDRVLRMLSKNNEDLL